jgi:hypothetical protein
MDPSLGDPQPMSELPVPGMPQLPGIAPQRPGMFGAGGVGRNIAGMIGDLLMARAGMQPMFAPMLMQRQKQALEEAQYQRQRSDQNADWLSHQEYEAAHKEPTMTEKFVAEILDPNTDPQRRELLKSVIVPPSPAPMTLQTPMGTYVGGRSEMPGAAVPQPGAVQDGYRFKGGNPADPNAWEKIGGPGLGGPGGFPLP